MPRMTPRNPRSVSMAPGHLQFASKVRKRFNRDVSLGVGTVVMDGTGKEGIFQGLSTHSKPNEIKVLAYPLREGDDRTQGVTLPREYQFAGVKLPVRLIVQERPEVTPPALARYSDYAY